MSEKIQVMREIARWIEKYDWKIYFNQTNTYNYPTFHSNTNSKCDLLAIKNNYVIGIEVKPCDKHNDVLNGTEQTLTYAGEYYSGRVQYFLDLKEKKPLKINGFYFCTRYSKFGYLYSKESKINYLDYTNFLAEELNMTEKPISHTITRFLWRQWEKSFAIRYFENLKRGEAIKQGIINKPRVGTILAKINRNNGQISEMPYLFTNSNHFIPMGSEEIHAF